MPTNHADLIPTLMGLAGIDADEALADAAAPTTPTRGHWSAATSRRASAVTSDERARADPVHHRRRDQRGQLARRQSPFQLVARKARDLLDRPAAEPHRDGGRRGRRRRRAAPGQALPLLRQPAVLDGAGRARRATAGRKTITVTEPEPDEFELYDLTVDPYEERNLADRRLRRRALPRVAAADARAAGRAAGAQAARPERRARSPATGRSPRLNPGLDAASRGFPRSRTPKHRTADDWPTVRFEVPGFKDRRADDDFAHMSVQTRPFASARDLLETGGLRAVFQPIVELGSGAILGYEALARGPVGSPLEMPDELFPVARAEGVLERLDRACRSPRHLQRRRRGHPGR